VAGRCKHCKQDLTAFRAGRPQAAAQLPALDGSAGNGHAAPVAPAPVPVPQILPREDSQPILPPRPTGEMPAAAAPQPSAWRRWPVLVIGIAGLAIVGAVVVLLWPPGATSHAGKLPPPPAPERMETNPMPPDPWGGGANTPNPSPPQQAPQPHAQITPRQTPDPLPPDDPDDTDQLDQLGQLGQLGQGLGSGNAATLLQIVEHLCDRLNQCGTTSSSMQMYCSTLSTIKGTMPKAPDCDARRRCLQKIDQISCSAQADDATAIMTYMTQFSDCMEAMRQC
jgi:hypothetical protein